MAIPVEENKAEEDIAIADNGGKIFEHRLIVQGLVTKHTNLGFYFCVWRMSL